MYQPGPETKQESVSFTHSPTKTDCHCVELLFALDSRHYHLSWGIFVLDSSLYQDKSFAQFCSVKWTASSRTSPVTCSQQRSPGLLLCLCVCVWEREICRSQRKSTANVVASPHCNKFTFRHTTAFSLTHPHKSTHIHTFFVIMADDGILQDIGKAEADSVLLAVGGQGSNLDAALLALKGLFSLVVSPYLVAAHPSNQPLALANGERLQQTLVYLHVLTKDIT